MEPTGSPQKDPYNSYDSYTSSTEKLPILSRISARVKGSGYVGWDPSGVYDGSVFPSFLTYPDWPSALEMQQQLLPMAVRKGDFCAMYYQVGCSSLRAQDLPEIKYDDMPPVVQSIVNMVLGKPNEYDRQFPSIEELERSEERKKARKKVHLPHFREIKISKHGFPKLGPPRTKGPDHLWIGINGFGQIGKLVAKLIMLRQHIKHFGIVTVPKKDGEVVTPKAPSKQLEIITINDPDVTAKEMKKYMDENGIHPGEFPDIKVSHFKNPQDIPWGKLEIDYVIESTNSDAAAAHLKSGAKKVVICDLSKDALVFVCGANQEKYTADIVTVSIPDCAINCIAPLAKIIHDIFGIADGFLTISEPCPGNADEPSCREWRDGVMVLGSVLPDLAGKFSSKVQFIPDLELSSVEMVLKLVDESADYERVKNAVRDELCRRELLDIVAYMDGVTELRGYECDVRSCLFHVDAGCTLDDNRIGIIARFNNDYSYSMRCIDMVLHMATVDEQKEGLLRGNRLPISELEPLL